MGFCSQEAVSIGIFYRFQIYLIEWGVPEHGLITFSTLILRRKQQIDFYGVSWGAHWTKAHRLCSWGAVKCCSALLTSSVLLSFSNKTDKIWFQTSYGWNERALRSWNKTLGARLYTERNSTGECAGQRLKNGRCQCSVEDLFLNNSFTEHSKPEATTRGKVTRSDSFHKSAQRQKVSESVEAESWVTVGHICLRF